MHASTDGPFRASSVDARDGVAHAVRRRTRRASSSEIVPSRRLRAKQPETNRYGLWSRHGWTPTRGWTRCTTKRQSRHPRAVTAEPRTRRPARRRSFQRATTRASAAPDGWSPRLQRRAPARATSGHAPRRHSRRHTSRRGVRARWQSFRSVAKSPETRPSASASARRRKDVKRKNKIMC